MAKEDMKAAVASEEPAADEKAPAAEGKAPVEEEKVLVVDEKKPAGDRISIRDVTAEKTDFWIKGRVVNTSGVVDGATGPFFSFDLRDTTGTIRYLAFGATIAKALADEVKIGGVFEIRDAFVGDERTETPTGHKFQLRNNRSSRTRVIAVVDDDASIPKLTDMVKLSDIALPETKSEPGVQAEGSSLVTVKEKVDSVSPLKSTANRATGQPLQLREVELIDKDGVKITLVLWNRHALDFSAEPGATILVKDAKVKEHDGKVKLTGSTTFSVTEVSGDEKADRPDDNPSPQKRAKTDDKSQ